MPSLILNGNKIGGTVDDSAFLRYSNEDSTLQAETIQDAVTELDEKVEANKVYTDEKIIEVNGKVDTDFTDAKIYTDEKVLEVKNDLLNGAGEAYDTLKELGDLIDENHDAIEALETIATSKVDSNNLINLIYPIGSIYMSVNNISPSTFLGGTWEQIVDKFLLSAGSSYAAGSTGGSATNTLTTENLPSHTHTVGAHSHGLNNHTHSIPALSGTAASAGAHTHNHVNTNQINGSLSGTVTDGVNVYSPNSTIKGLSTDGAHTHTVTTTASTTGKASGSTANSTAFNSGATGNGTAINNMPPYLAVYMWKRTA